MMLVSSSSESDGVNLHQNRKLRVDITHMENVLLTYQKGEFFLDFRVLIFIAQASSHSTSCTFY